jgi:beta-phosphoglucomutase-like phosphatase (HAD superfamily)
MLHIQFGAKRAGTRVLGFTGGRHGPPGHGIKLMEAVADAVCAQLNELRSMLPDGFDQSAEAS